MAQPPGTPACTIQPKAQAARPMTLATERSISPLMMTKVMTRATMIFSTDNWNMLIWLPTVRKTGEFAVFSA
ncbi:MAG: hypothetical protein MUE52_21085 [Tabrizicola sp.]|nr:hypothetical protein [Tabrizicola sp.]